MKLEQLIGSGALEELRTKWGNSCDLRLKAAEEMLSNAEPEHVVALEQEFGPRALLESAVDLAEHLYGPLFIGEPIDGAMAVDAVRARAELGEMKSNPEFMEKWSAGDQASNDAFRHATERATPERAEE